MKKITIKEGKVSRKFTTGKLRTLSQDGIGWIDWVPESEAPLTTLYVSKKGVYTPPKYGFSYVDVHVFHYLSGFDPDDGKYKLIGLDDDEIIEAELPCDLSEFEDFIVGYEDGELEMIGVDEFGNETEIELPEEFNKLIDDDNSLDVKDQNGNDVNVSTNDGNIERNIKPSSIHITSLPYQLTYTEWAMIHFEGLQVTAYNNDGSVWGEVPLSECKFSHYVANPGGATGTATSQLVDGTVNFWGTDFWYFDEEEDYLHGEPYITWLEYTREYKNGNKMACIHTWNLPGIHGGFTNLVLIASALPFSCKYFEHGIGKTGLGDSAHWEYYVSKVHDWWEFDTYTWTFNNKTVYFLASYQWLVRGGWGVFHTEVKPEIQYGAGEYFGIGIDQFRYEQWGDLAPDDKKYWNMDVMRRKAWTVIYGDLNFQLPIEVSWTSPYGDVLTDVFYINIIRSGEV